MTVFAALALGLTVLLLALLLWPLLRKQVVLAGTSQDERNLDIYRDQLRELDDDRASGLIDETQYAQGRREIERRVLEETAAGEGATPPATTALPPARKLAIALAVVIPLLSVGAYLKLGNTAALDPANTQRHEVTPEMVAGMIDQLKAKLAQNPDGPDALTGWLMLAKTTYAMNRFDDAAKAYREVIKRKSDDPDVLTDAADVIGAVQGKLDGEPEQLINKALQLDPKHLKALALAGTAAFDRNEFAKAADVWQKILEILPPDAEVRSQIEASINEARQKASGKGVGKAEAKPKAAAGVTLRGRVDLSPEAKAAAAPTDTVFVFARAASGPKMPLAIVRLQVKDLPKDFTLDESMAMTPQMTIATVPELVIGARLSKTGNATPAPGDWEAAVQPVKAGASGLRLRIETPVK